MPTAHVPLATGTVAPRSTTSFDFSFAMVYGTPVLAVGWSLDNNAGTTSSQGTAVTTGSYTMDISGFDDG